MARSDSGRIVIEVDPALKHDLYVELARRDTTLKAWFMANAQELVDLRGQLILFEPDRLSSSDQVAPPDAPSTGGR